MEAVNLSFIFTWDDGKIEDRAKVSTSSLFEGLLINNIELRDILNKNNMHDNTNMTGNKNDKITSQEIRVARDYEYTFTLTKIKFKVTTIERQSL